MACLSRHDRQYKKRGSASIGRFEMLQMLHKFGTFGRVTFRANETNETQKQGVPKASHLGSKSHLSQEKYRLSERRRNETPICRASHFAQS